MRNLACMIFIFSILLASTASASTYTLSYYSTNTSATAGTIQGMSVKEGEGCTAALTERGYFTGTNFDIGVNYYSPDSTQIGTATRTGLNQIVCSSFGTYSTSTDLNLFLEGYADYTASADDGNLTLSSIYSCTESSLYYDIEADMTDDDSWGNLAYRYGGSNTGFTTNASLASQAYESNFYNCYSNLHTHAPWIYISSSGSSAVDYRRTAYAYYPFNSGSEGIVDYWFNLGNATYSVLDCSDSCTGTQSGYFDVFLVNVEDESYTTLYSYSADCAGSPKLTGELEGSKTLDSDTEYMIVTASRNDDSGIVAPCARSYKHREPLAFNISVYVYEPDWNCSEYSACEGGEQYRTCNDLNGIAVPKTEFQTCAPIILQNATLGFEKYYTDFALKCVPNWGSLVSYPIYGYCSYDIQTISRDTPLGWTVYEDYTDEGIQRDFLRMTSEWRTEGFRSLKMWYIPPKMGEPITNSTCGNATYGQIPLIYKNVSNDTFSVSYNVTFPAENMLLSFDVKGCPNQVEQNGPLAAFVLEACPQQCYANNCSSIPDSSYQFFMRNSTGEIITNYYDDYADPYDSDTINLDLTGLGIVAGEIYTLSFQAMPENLNTQDGNCVMFDNVRYSVMAEPYPVNCSVGSKCIGTTLYITHEYENGACVVVKKDNACGLPTDIIDKIANREDYCDLEDSDILMRYDYDISDWREIECEYGCLDDKCVTQEDIDEAATQPSTTLEYIYLVFSVPSILSMFIALICVIISLKRDHAWPLALFGIAQLIFVESIIGVLSIWFAVGEILLACIIFAYFVSKTAGGGG